MNPATLKKVALSIISWLLLLFGLNPWQPIPRKYGPPKVRFTRLGFAALTLNFFFMVSWVCYSLLVFHLNITDIHKTNLTVVGQKLYTWNNVLRCSSTQIALWIFLCHRKVIFQKLLLVNFKLSKLKADIYQDSGSFLMRTSFVVGVFFAYYCVKLFLALKMDAIRPGTIANWYFAFGYFVPSYFNFTFIFYLTITMAGVARRFKTIDKKLIDLSNKF